MVTNTKMESAQNADPGEEHSPVARAGTQTRDLSITSPVLHTTELPLLNTILQHTWRVPLGVVNGGPGELAGCGASDA